MPTPNTCCSHAAPRLFFSFNVEYHIAPAAQPFDLLDDASMLLGTAFHLLDHATTAMEDADEKPDPKSILALCTAAAQMVQMGKNAMGAAHTSLLRERAGVRHG